jgi:hypothetical protein
MKITNLTWCAERETHLEHRDLISLLAYRCLQDAPSLLGSSDSRWNYQDNGADILAVAHCDHYNYGAPIQITGKGKVISSALDDRAGLHAILDLLPLYGIAVDTLLTTDEERGQSTARDWLRSNGGKLPKDYRYVFSFDRAGRDAVYYEPMPAEFIDAAKAHWEIGLGSYSDVAEFELLAPHLNCGISYRCQHTGACNLFYSDLLECVERFARFHANTLGMRWTMPTERPHSHIWKSWDWKETSPGNYRLHELSDEDLESAPRWDRCGQCDGWFQVDQLDHRGLCEDCRP